MYETPFISALYVVPRPPLPARPPAPPFPFPLPSPRPSPLRCTGAFSTRSISRSGWWIPSATPTTTSRFPANRLGSTSLSAAMMIPSASLTSLSVSAFSTPIEPCVSTFISCPSARAAWASFSAAM